jgi:hypothetical protein
MCSPQPKEVVMKRVLATSAGVASIGTLLLASIALGSTSGTQAVAAKSQVTILSRAKERADHTFGGPFVLAVKGVNQDAGASSIGPHLTERTVGGQQGWSVTGNNTLTGKKGVLSISFRGVNITVHNVDSTKFPSEVEYGTWKVIGGTGMYKGWKGGGRYASPSTPGVAQNIEWNGSVTR